MNNFEKRLSMYAAKQTGEMPIICEFDFDTKKWLVGFKSKLACYTYYIETYKCDPTLSVGFSENLNCFFVKT